MQMLLDKFYLEFKNQNKLLTDLEYKSQFNEIENKIMNIEDIEDGLYSNCIDLAINYNICSSLNGN